VESGKLRMKAYRESEFPNIKALMRKFENPNIKFGLSLFGHSLLLCNFLIIFKKILYREFLTYTLNSPLTLITDQHNFKLPLYLIVKIKSP
jgi:hypothetical protein